MSQEQAKAFVERMKSDEAFAARVLAVEEGEQRLAFIRAEGYDCSAEEIAAEGGRLRDAEMTAVVGGACRDDCGLHPPTCTNILDGYLADG